MIRQNLGTEWLTDLRNLIVVEGKIADDWQYSVLLPVFKGKRGPMECGCYCTITCNEGDRSCV